MTYQTRACRSTQAFHTIHGIHCRTAVADLCHSSLIPQVTHALLPLCSSGT